MRTTQSKIVRCLITLLAVVILSPTLLSAQVVEEQEATSAQLPQQQAQQPQQQEVKKEKKKKDKTPVAIVDFKQGFTVRSGEKILPVVRTTEQDSLEAAELTRLIDSLVVARENIIPEDTVARSEMASHIDSLVAKRTSLLPAVVDSLDLKRDSLASDTLPKPRYNWLFRDSLSLGTTTALSVVLPGFAQLYEENYWKIPLEYAMVGLPLWGGLHQHKIYRGYKAEFDKLASTGATQQERTPVQTKMLKHQSYSTLFLGAAVASYMGFLVDGVINHPSDLSDIQKATTLSLVCPGAGQIYNGSYWKVPIVVVGLASMAYVIDWNQRGYVRFKTAFDLATDDDDTTIGEFPNTSTESLRSIKNSYRRNRDLAIIGTVAVYLVQVADAHIDAHMQAYDISDNLSMKIEPQVTQTVTPDGLSHNFGFNVTMNF